MHAQNSDSPASGGGPVSVGGAASGGESAPVGGAAPGGAVTTEELLPPLFPDQAQFTADPHLRYAQLRATHPVQRVMLPQGAPAWIVTGGKEVRSALTDPRLCNDIKHSGTWEADGGFAIGLNMLQVDPPVHTRLRRLVAGTFTHRRVKALGPRVEQIAEDLLDALAPLKGADLVESFAFPLPVTVICELLGVPTADRAAFQAWSALIVTATDPEAAVVAGQEMTSYLTGLIKDKIDASTRTVNADADAPGKAQTAASSSPSPSATSSGEGHDLLTALALAGDGADAALTPEELLGMAFLLLVAGHETTANLISSAVYLLLQHPEQLAALRADPSLISGAIEETLRYEPPALAVTYRYASEPLTLGGVDIPKGDALILSLAAANRDPADFPDPDRFDIHRDPATTASHLAFGHGIHHCLGAPLARMEGAIALRALLQRCPDLRLDGTNGTPAWRPSLLRGLAALPVRW
ncbi:cytochrome P450 [Streptomyces sp. NBC_01283]|uniref:cytochrome P450 family protein n=1 Tax=Streptomyces sp. NBC_01283 TaxID=2903812 RepID=UPI00352F0A3C|nr:cytochrome P450 [Streptomyces sp. NBC_01283]